MRLIEPGQRQQPQRNLVGIERTPGFESRYKLGRITKNPTPTKEWDRKW